MSITVDGKLVVGPPQPQFLAPPDGVEIVVEPPQPQFLTPPSPAGAIVVPVGGPPGPQGEQGPPGSGAVSGMQVLIRTYASPVTPWIHEHGLGTYPDVITLEDDQVIDGDVSYPDLNTVRVDWYYPQTGKLLMLY